MRDWQRIRSEFPATEGQTWLNTATYGPGPQPVIEAVQRAHDGWATGRGSWTEWEQQAERARERFAKLLGTSPETIALLPTVSAGAGQVAALGHLDQLGHDLSQIVIGHAVQQ